MTVNIALNSVESFLSFDESSTFLDILDDVRNQFLDYGSVTGQMEFHGSQVHQDRHKKLHRTDQLQADSNSTTCVLTVLRFLDFATISYLLMVSNSISEC